MNKEEITFSEELRESLSWKEWVKENKVFIGVILGLATLSLILSIPTHKNEIIAPVVAPLKPTHKIKLRIIKTGPLDQAKKLFSESKIAEAISLLLDVSKNNSDIRLQTKASELAKHYHTINIEHEKLRKKYLQGYILFQTYPNKACEQWSQALRSPLTSDMYYKKTQRRFTEECTITHRQFRYSGSGSKAQAFGAEP